MSDSLITSNIDVASNEYLTKFSINRNFERLLSNDIYLKSKSTFSSMNFYSYGKNRVFQKDDLVFYKPSTYSTKIYLLCSLVNYNTYDPCVVKNSLGEDVVSSANQWAIVGIPDNTEGLSPTNIADQYVLESKKTFQTKHESNTDLSAHPSGLLGGNNSTILLKSFRNISSNRDTFFYPYKIQKLTTDNTILGGYMRIWDNGLLEYDVIFRLGYSGTTSEGYQLLSANNIQINQRNYNYLYFKEASDYRIFNKGDSYQAMVGNQKQVNLNQHLNSYYGEILFPYEFKDLNYMVFTSGIKNITTQSYDTRNQAIPEYDSRLNIEGYKIVGHVDPDDIEYGKSYTYKDPVQIPSQIKTIADSSLQDIKYGIDKESYDTNIVEIIIPQDADLLNIGDEAFMRSNIAQINIPKNVRRIGKNAFSNCSLLTAVDFYVYPSPSKQPKIEKDAFAGSDIRVINIHYLPEPLLATYDLEEEERRVSAYSDLVSLRDKVTDPLYRYYQLGIISSGVEINEDGEVPVAAPSYSEYLKTTLNQEDEEENEYEVEQEECNFVSLGVNELLNQLSSTNTGKLKTNNFRSTLFKASTTSLDTICKYFTLAKTSSTSSITGYTDALRSYSGLYTLDFSKFDSTATNLTGIQENALNGCTKIGKFVGQSPLVSIGDNAFYGCTSLTSLTIGTGITSVGSNAFSNCGTITEASLKCNQSSNKSPYSTTAFSGSTVISKLTIPSGADTVTDGKFLNVIATSVTADMTGSFFGKETFYGSTITSLTLKDIQKATTKTVGDPPDVTTIQGFADQAFSGCTVPSITLTGSIDTDYANDKNNRICLPLNTIIYYSGKVYKYIGEGEEAGETIVFRIPDYITMSGLTITAFSNAKLATAISKGDKFIIPAIATRINDNVFKPDSGYATQLTSVTIPSKIQYIGNSAFSGNEGLLTMTIPTDVELTYLGSDFVKDCSLVTSLKFRVS